MHSPMLRRGHDFSIWISTLPNADRVQDQTDGVPLLGGGFEIRGTQLSGRCLNVTGQRDD